MDTSLESGDAVLYSLFHILCQSVSKISTLL